MLKIIKTNIIICGTRTNICETPNGTKVVNYKGMYKEIDKHSNIIDKDNYTNVYVGSEKGFELWQSERWNKDRECFEIITKKVKIAQ